jgi:hypothetical protein
VQKIVCWASRGILDPGQAFLRRMATRRMMPARIVSTSRARSASLWPGAFHLVFSITRARFG